MKLFTKKKASKKVSVKGGKNGEPSAAAAIDAWMKK